MAVAIVVELEAIHIEHEKREQMFRAKCAVGLGLEPAVEMTAVEEPRERIGFGKALERFTLLLHHQHLADVPSQKLERLEIGVVERFAIVSIGHAQHTAGIVANKDRHADE